MKANKLTHSLSNIIYPGKYDLPDKVTMHVFVFGAPLWVTVVVRLGDCGGVEQLNKPRAKVNQTKTAVTMEVITTCMIESGKGSSVPEASACHVWDAHPAFTQVHGNPRRSPILTHSYPPLAISVHVIFIAG
jgi:hypothetical protein